MDMRSALTWKDHKRRKDEKNLVTSSLFGPDRFFVILVTKQRRDPRRYSRVRDKIGQLVDIPWCSIK